MILQPEVHFAKTAVWRIPPLVTLCPNAAGQARWQIVAARGIGFSNAGRWNCSWRGRTRHFLSLPKLVRAAFSEFPYRLLAITFGSLAPHRHNRDIQAVFFSDARG